MLKKTPVIVLIFSEASKDKIEIQFPGRESKTNSENVFLSLSYFYRFDNYGIGVGTKILLCNYIFGKTSSQTGGPTNLITWGGSFNEIERK